jgi:hypothetical protein
VPGITVIQWFEKKLGVLGASSFLCDKLKAYAHAGRGAIAWAANSPIHDREAGHDESVLTVYVNVSDGRSKTFKICSSPPRRGVTGAVESGGHRYGRNAA